MARRLILDDFSCPRYLTSVREYERHVCLACHMAWQLRLGLGGRRNKTGPPLLGHFGPFAVFHLCSTAGPPLLPLFSALPRPLNN